MKNGFALASGKIVNPGKAFYLGLAAAAVRDVNAIRDADGIRYARKAMIRTGMGLNINGQWEERQLFPRSKRLLTSTATISMLLLLSISVDSDGCSECMFDKCCITFIGLEGFYINWSGLHYESVGN